MGKRCNKLRNGTDMKKIMKLAVISSFVALGIATANAQVVVLPVNFALSGFKQSGDTATTVRLSNKDMFNALNENGSGLSRRAPKVTVTRRAGIVVPKGCYPMALVFG